MINKRGYCSKIPFSKKRNNIKKYTESNLVKQALFGEIDQMIYTFAIITAENPDALSYSSKENNKRLSNMEDDLRELHLVWKKIAGKFGNKEHSFLVINLALHDAMWLGKKYGQQSFFFGVQDWQDVGGEQRPTTSTISYYQFDKISRKYFLIEKSNKINNLPEAEDFFSRYGDYKFSINMKVFEGMKPTKVFSLRDFKESIDSNYTMRHRANMRVLCTYDWRKRK